jgi:hypothetical protein
MNFGQMELRYQMKHRLQNAIMNYYLTGEEDDNKLVSLVFGLPPSSWNDICAITETDFANKMAARSQDSSLPSWWSRPEGLCFLS